MELIAKKKSRRISVWVLVFALILSIVSATLILPAHAENFLGDVRQGAREVESGMGGAMSDVGEAVSDIGEGMSEAVSDIGDMGNAEDGKVSDSDGIIGNQESETDDAGENGGMGWLALVITLVVVLIVIVLIVLLIPKKKDR